MENVWHLQIEADTRSYSESLRARPSSTQAALSFEAIYEAHYTDVARYVLLTTRGRDDVEEIVAETFARGFAAWREGRGPAGRALPWLLVIARHLVTDRWRRRRLVAWLPIQGHREFRANDTEAEAREFWLWLDALSRTLPSRQREVLFLRYQRDLTDDEVGEILKISASGVRTLASRAISALRNHPELWS